MPKHGITLKLTQKQYDRLRAINTAGGWQDVPKSLRMTARLLLDRAMRGPSDVLHETLTDTGFVAPGGWEVVESNKRVFVAVPK
jgi:hypothetical protein